LCQGRPLQQCHNIHLNYGTCPVIARAVQFNNYSRRTRREPDSNILNKFRFILYGTALFLFSGACMADAIVRSQAMFASTIAEFFVENDHVRLELEIGEPDIAAFRNLLPDGIFEKLAFEAEGSFEERLALFTGRDMMILADGKPLKGFVSELGPGVRPLRDEITGEALPTPEEDEEIIIRAVFRFPFDQPPAELTLTVPSLTGQAGIGFVLYHEGVAVNDFRYLSNGITVRLDWEDAWYSTFTSRALSRQYFSPMTGFIYVEPYEVRKEIIVRPSDIQKFTDLGLANAKSIPAEKQEEIKQKVVEFLAGHFPVTIDGVKVEGSVDRVNFLQRTLKSSTVVSGQDLDLLPATIGVIYVFPTNGLPQEVELTWDIFTEKMPRVPVAAVDQAGPLPSLLEPDYNILRWENFLRFPELPTLAELEAPPSALQRASGWMRWAGLSLNLIFAGMLLRSFVRSRRFQPAYAIALLLTLAVTTMTFRDHRQSSLDPERLQKLVGNLLHNVYRAFDYRGEEVIYDVLARSVSGDLLADIYLETRNSLELASQGGARVKVNTVEMTGTELKDRSGNRLTVSSEWVVSGSVGHWGHVHQRINSYQAELEISEIDKQWKLTGLEILQEERL